jgi:hypothetical protein
MGLFSLFDLPTNNFLSIGGKAGVSSAAEGIATLPFWQQAEK